MEDESRKWDREKMTKEMKEAEGDFETLQYDLLNLMVRFSLRALKTFQAGKNEEINRLQLNEIVNREIKSIIGDLSDLEFIEMIIKKTEVDFYSGKSEPLKQNKT